jgi:hypothetical protein
MNINIKKRTSVINYFIEKHQYKTYLEIGIGNPKRNFNKVICQEKDGVDPAVQCNYQMTSDEFFKKIDKNKKYDIIFIDGLHLEEQVMKDILHSLDHLNLNGTIIVHDCNPLSEERQIEEYEIGKNWSGTVWKAFAKLRMTRDDIEMYVIRIDSGVGIIKFGKQECFPQVTSDKLVYKFLRENRKKLLNLYKRREFIQRESEEK